MDKRTFDRLFNEFGKNNMELTREISKYVRNMFMEIFNTKITETQARKLEVILEMLGLDSTKRQDFFVKPYENFKGFDIYLRFKYDVEGNISDCWFYFKDDEYITYYTAERYIDNEIFFRDNDPETDLASINETAMYYMKDCERYIQYLTFLQNLHEKLLKYTEKELKYMNMETLINLFEKVGLKKILGKDVEDFIFGY